MTNTDLLRAMGRIDPELIADAAPNVTRKKSVYKIWIKQGAIAACLAVIAAAFLLKPKPGSLRPSDAVPSHEPSDTFTDVSDAPAPSGEAISVIDLSGDNPGEFAGDMHRPEGFHKNIGSALALKMSVTDDEGYLYSVLIRIPEGSTLEEALRLANEHLQSPISAVDVLSLRVSGGLEEAGFFCRLTSAQIVALAESGTWCLYVGSGQGDPRDMNWDTKDGINTYCELNGDMYVLAGGGIEAHPDIGIDE